MIKYRIPKDEIDEKNPLIKGTFFEIAKNSEVGSGNDTIDLESDDYVTYQFISGKYDLNSSLDRCMVDNDKFIVINAIQMYNYGVNYDDILKLVMNNKYSYLFIETVLKDNPFTKNIIYYLCNIESSNIGSYIDCDGNDFITWVCKNETNYSILEIIKKFGEKVLPKKIDKLLNLLLERDFYEVCIKLIDNFGDKINFDYVNSEGNTLLMEAYAHFSGDVASKLIEKFGELCKFDHVNKYGDTALIMGCNNVPEYELFDFLKFGDKCKPDHVNNNGDTALIVSCSNTGLLMPSYLIDSFGEKCKPEQVNNYGNTALHYAINNREVDIAIKLIYTFGMKCKPEQVNKDGKTALDLAIKNNMHGVVSKLKTLLDDH